MKEIRCTCGHSVEQHTYSADFTGCDVVKCTCHKNIVEVVAAALKAGE